LIMKELQMPPRLILTTIVKKRLVKDHIKHPIIEKDLAKRRAGYWGEITLSNYLKELPQENYLIFYDLQLELSGIHFQIDALLVSIHFILIIEAKNIIGTLVFDNVFKQLLRIHKDNEDESFEDPRVQAQRLQSLLRRWLKKNGCDILPIDHLVFFKSATNTILKFNPGDKADLSKICKGRDLFNKINAMEQRYKSPLTNKKTITEIGNLLLSSHTPTKVNILEEYDLTEKDILSGAGCPKESCMHIPMNYNRGNWICPVCQTTSKDTCIDALHDYFYLYKPTITNSEFRSFLHIPTIHAAQKKLSILNLPMSGTTRGRIYHLQAKEDSLCDF
jgi:hypothetical protein